MRIYDIISHKRDKKELSDEEIAYFVKGYTEKKIESYQASALLMAIYLNGMTDREMFTLTNEMAKSGDMLDLSEISGITADKHSTGGVGDKTTLIVAPIVASLGTKVAKMSGRGLGHTGGTIDKLESISGFNVSLPPEKFIKQVNEIGISVVGQTGNLAPADKEIYSLRNATATVASIPLIASSIMSKKIAAGSQCIVLDVKTGSGAFMKTQEDAKALCEKMVSIGKAAGRKVAALITNMDIPLGRNIGNSLEVIEAVDVLKGKTDSDLAKVSMALAANMVLLSQNVSYETAEKMVENAIFSGKAYQKMIEFVSAQGGNTALIEDTAKFPKASATQKIIAEHEGYISKMDCEKVGTASMILGTGRSKKDSKIDYSAGIILHKKTGEYVKKGDVIAEMFSNERSSFAEAENIFLSSLSFSSQKPQPQPLIYETIR